MLRSACAWSGLLSVAVWCFGIASCSGAELPPAGPPIGPPGAEQAPQPYSGDTPLGPRESHARLTLPKGFSATLFAAEPDVLQPIAMQIDSRGRLWVAECFSYPNWAEKGNDRLLIFEDTDGDGRFDTRKVFWEEGNYLTGFELGFGGVWVCCAPHLLFLPDRDADDRPDGPPQVLLDGWSTKGVHNVVNGLVWGPDGWLWGMNGITSPSLVGPPGATEEQRQNISCGVWRFHPTRKTFEVVAHGTTNPWGLDFDDHGQAFFTNCVIEHVFHLVPGAHYKRMFGNDYNPYVYELMPACCDHLHWGGGAWTDSRGGQGKHNAPGGGHAHAGAMIYLGDRWPDAYRGSLFTVNVHGNRVNNDLLVRRGSGYVARHGHDFLFANDVWFRALNMKYGPDGNVFLIDWNDSEECHDRQPTHRETGRVYKVNYGAPQPAPRVDLAQASTAELVALQSHKNDYFVRTARRILQERAAAGADLNEAKQTLAARFDAAPTAPGKLRALWALHALGAADGEWLLGLLAHTDEHVRSWAVRLLIDAGPPSAGALARFEELAASDCSSLVRLFLASALQRLPLKQRFGLAEKLLAHGEDADDPLLPLAIWYGVEPAVGANKVRAAALLTKCQIPKVRQFIARRVSEAK